MRIEDRSPYNKSGVFIFHSTKILRDHEPTPVTRVIESGRKGVESFGETISTPYVNRLLKEMENEDLIETERMGIVRGWATLDYHRWADRYGVGKYIREQDVPWVKSYLAEHDEYTFGELKQNWKRAVLWRVFMQLYLEGNATVTFRKK